MEKLSTNANARFLIGNFSVQTERERERERIESLKWSEIRVGSGERRNGERGGVGVERRYKKEVAKGFQSKYTSLAYRCPINYYLRKISCDVATLINISIFLPGKPISFLPMPSKRGADAAESREIRPSYLFLFSRSPQRGLYRPGD